VGIGSITDPFPTTLLINHGITEKNKGITTLMTINMEIGLITPPVGLNLFVIQGIAPDISIGKILKGSFPFVLLMMLQIILLCIFPEIATWLPEAVMK
jgi:TRAP-type C4-dicarboxylate transport system permease large subunit